MLRNLTEELSLLDSDRLIAIKWCPLKVMGETQGCFPPLLSRMLSPMNCKHCPTAGSIIFQRRILLAI